jgi:predicted sulfurtransferase
MEPSSSNQQNYAAQESTLNGAITLSGEGGGGIFTGSASSTLKGSSTLPESLGVASLENALPFFSKADELFHIIPHKVRDRIISRSYLEQQ